METGSTSLNKKKCIKPTGWPLLLRLFADDCILFLRLKTVTQHFSDFIKSRLLSRIMNCTRLLGNHMCGCLIISTQTYCIALQELGKPLIPKTMYKVDHSLLAGSFPVPQTWSTLLMSPSSPAVWAQLQPLHWQLSEGCSRKPLPTWRHHNWLESCSFHVESEFSCYLKDSQKLRK